MRVRVYVQITQYMFTPPAVGALLGQLGGLKGLLTDVTGVVLIATVYLDVLLDRRGKYNKNKDKYKAAKVVVRTTTT